MPFTFLMEVSNEPAPSGWLAVMYVIAGLLGGSFGMKLLTYFTRRRDNSDREQARRIEEDRRAVRIHENQMIQHLEEEVNRLRSQVESLNTQVSALRDSREGLLTQLTGLQSQLTVLQSERVKFQTDLDVRKKNEHALRGIATAIVLKAYELQRKCKDAGIAYEPIPENLLAPLTSME